MVDRRRAALAFAGTGGWIFYNTNVLNPFVSRHVAQRQQAEYEKHYKALAGAPQPQHHGGRRARRAPSRAEPRPGRRPLDARQQDRRGDPRPLRRLPEPRDGARDGVRPPGAARRRANRICAGITTSLDRPLAPGAATDLRFDLGYGAKGFANGGADPVVLDNGTFVNAGLTPETSLVPSLGYDECRRTHVRPRSQEVRPRAQTADARPRRCCAGRCTTHSRATPTSSTSARMSAPPPTSCR